MSKPITKIELSCFRGSTRNFELEFDHAKDMSMLFGENGTGKSTILDAIDVVCNETIGCLEGVSVGRSPGQYLCSVGSPPTNLKVAVHSNAELWTGTMNRNSITVAGAADRPVVKILRRNKILELVTAQPKDRYAALSRFIDIGVVEKSEGTLQQKLTAIGSQIDRLIAERNRMSQQLNDLWEQEGRPGGISSMAWASSRVEEGIDAIKDRLERLKLVTKAIADATAAKTDYEARKAKCEQLEQDLADAEESLQQAPGVSAATAVQMLESLEKAKAYIEAEQSVDKCPTCQRDMTRDELLRRVNTEFEQLGELKKLNDDKQRIAELLRTARSHLAEAVKKITAAGQGLHQATEPGDIPEIEALGLAWPDWTVDPVDIDALILAAGQAATTETVLVEQRDQAQRDVNQFNSIKQWWTGITEADEQLADLARIRNGLQKAHEIVHEKRVTFTQGILDGIRLEADRLYQVIHPGEAIGLEQLKMEEERRGSVSQTGTFNGHSDVPPQAVFSESHLDTLGFCVWLALAKRESPDHTILLVDDIFSSVDATHLGRVIDLLATESKNFLQVVVATHYRLWWDRCQNAHGIQRVHLGRWSAASGMAAQNMPRVLDELRAKVAEAVLDRQAVSSKAGILLESLLDDLALLYAQSLPRNKLNEYTLGALLGGCGKLFSKHALSVEINGNWNADGQPEDWQASDPKAAFDAVNAMVFIRNQVGCHFSPPGMDIPDDDVRSFGDATVALVEAVTCPNCGVLPTKKANDGTHLRCSCSKRAAKMTPVAIA